MSVNYTDRLRVTEVRVEPVGRKVKGQGSAYGSKMPTRFMVKYDGRWRRVYVMQYSNAGSAFIIVDGDDVFLDLDTQNRLEVMGR